METRKRKSSEVMLPYIISVLKRDEIPYEVEKGCIISAPISNRGFTEILEDALCEKQRDETECKIPVYSYRTIRNPEKFSRLKKLNGKKGFHVLQQDIPKFKEAGMFGF